MSENSAWEKITQPSHAEKAAFSDSDSQDESNNANHAVRAEAMPGCHEYDHGCVAIAGAIIEMWRRG